MEKKGKRLLNILKTTCPDKNKRVLEGVLKPRMQRGQLKGCSEDMKDTMLLLLSYFDEKEETLFHYVDETCMTKEVQVESLCDTMYHCLWRVENQYNCTKPKLMLKANTLY